MKSPGRFWRNEQQLFWILRWVLGAVFIWASWPKIFNPQAFAGIVANYRLLPPSLLNPVSLLIPWLELLCGLLLISGYLVRGASLVIVLLLSVFLAALLQSLLRGIDLSCGCFSVETHAGGGLPLDILRDLLLLFAGLWMLYYAVKSAQLAE